MHYKALESPRQIIEALRAETKAMIQQGIEEATFKKPKISLPQLRIINFLLKDIIINIEKLLAYFNYNKKLINNLRNFF